MILLDDLCDVLDSLGIPWTNEQPTDEQKSKILPPYIALVAGYGETQYADNTAWLRWMPYDVALYTRHRDYALERKVAAALDDAGCAYTLGVTNIESEGLVEAAFSVDVDEEPRQQEGQ